MKQRMCSVALVFKKSGLQNRYTGSAGFMSPVDMVFHTKQQVSAETPNRERKKTTVMAHTMHLNCSPNHSRSQLDEQCRLSWVIYRLMLHCKNLFYTSQCESFTVGLDSISIISVPIPLTYSGYSEILKIRVRDRQVVNPSDGFPGAPEPQTRPLLSGKKTAY